MKLQDIKEIAASRGVKPGKAKKVELVRMIQVAEGNADCYASSIADVCNQDACLWRDDCAAEAKKAG